MNGGALAPQLHGAPLRGCQHQRKVRLHVAANLTCALASSLVDPDTFEEQPLQNLDAVNLAHLVVSAPTQFVE